MLTWAIVYLSVQLMKLQTDVKGDLGCLFVLAIAGDVLIFGGIIGGAISSVWGCG